MKIKLDEVLTTLPQFGYDLKATSERILKFKKINMKINVDVKNSIVNLLDKNAPMQKKKSTRL